MQKYFYIIFTMFMATVFSAQAAKQTVATDQEDNISNDILIICSYDPDVPNTAITISDFYIIHQRRKSTNNMVVESLYCRDITDWTDWSKRMVNILQKHFANGKRPAAIVLLGTEAASVYFSLDTNMFNGELTRVPIFFGMQGRNIIRIPTEDTDLTTWHPQSLDILNDFKQYNIMGGTLYQYDAEKNIKLIKKLFPQTKQILFISDNTLGGINMQALVMKQAAKQHSIKIEYCDGRQLNLVELKEKIKNINDNNTAILLGTWRIDHSLNYVVSSPLSSLAQANPQVPTFTMSSTGYAQSKNTKSWAIGGFMPVFTSIGKDLAQDCINFLDNDSSGIPNVIPGNYRFDYKRLKTFNISTKDLPKDNIIEYAPTPFLKEHIILVCVTLAVVLILVISLIVMSHFTYRTKTLNAQLASMNIELTKAKEDAEESNRLKSSFLANISHEIRTPLNAIVGFSSIITSPMADDMSQEEKNEMGELIQANTNVLLKLINDILDLSRIESGKTVFNLHPQDIVSICNIALVTAEQNRKNKNTEYQLDIKVDSLNMVTDADRLQQVLTNLLSNAAKCTESGFIRLGLEKDTVNNMAVFSVTDSGCGIPKEKAKKIFERFEKLDNFKQGAGLGLSICQVTIEKLGGKIWVDTDYTGGARFMFTHPLDLHEVETKII